MSDTNQIPEISVTIDDFEQNEDNSLLDIAEALTDIEDLFDSREENVPKTKSTLKIKLNKNDYITDLEDLEASDNEGVHAYKFQEQCKIFNFDDDKATTKTEIKTLKGLKQIKDDGLTDMEDFGTDDEPEENAVPDIEYNYDEYLKNDISIASCLKKNLETKSHHHKKNLFKNYRLKVDLELQQNLTDSEILLSDSDEDTKITTRRRRPKYYQKHTDCINKDENLLCKYKKTKPDSLNLYKNTKSLTFPICKKVSSNSQYENLTDCENFDFDLNTPSTPNMNDEVIAEEFSTIIKNYGMVQEKHKIVSQDVASPAKNVSFQELFPKYIRTSENCNVEITDDSSNSTADDEMSIPCEFQLEKSEMPEIVLPIPVRTLTVLHEDESIPDTVKPLDKLQFEENEDGDVFTDNETLEFSDNLFENGNDVTLPTYLQSVSDEYQKNSSKELMTEKNEESLTDTDEIDLITKSSKKSKNFNKQYLTDTQHLYKGKSFLAVLQTVEGTTDIEDLSSSDDQESHFSKLRKMSRIKHNENVCFKNKKFSGKYGIRQESNKLMKELNEFHFTKPRNIKKSITERPNNLGLKVENDRQGFTDVEEIEEEDISCGKLKRSVSLNFKDGSVCFGVKKELDFVKKSTPPREKVELKKEVEDVPLMNYKYQLYESRMEPIFTKPNISLPHYQSDYSYKTTSLKRVGKSIDYDLTKHKSEPCVNILEILPSANAVIEIPLKKSYKTSCTIEFKDEITNNDVNSNIWWEGVYRNLQNGSKKSVKSQKNLLFQKATKKQQTLPQNDQGDDYCRNLIARSFSNSCETLKYLKTPKKLDFYSSTPFLYNSNQLNPLTHFISYSFKDKSEIPKAYCDWLISTEETIKLLTKTTQIATDSPKPKPRSTKTPSDLQQISQDKQIKQEKQISPVRDDLLDDIDQLETYSDKKKFWEDVSKEATIKRMSLHEISATDKELFSKKRASVQILGDTTPTPKPRTLQSSQSIPETETKSKTPSLEGEKAPSDDKIISEYKSQFVPPSKMKIETFDIKKDSSDSDSSDTALRRDASEPGGYISDSGDVEKYISDTEIEDRVPQIRERQMSVFTPPVANTRKSVYDRSASLPTEDMYEVSARTLKARKDYYVEQIKKEMIEEQLTSELEEEPSPEKKTLIGSSLERIDSIEVDSPQVSKEPPKEPIANSKFVKKISQTFDRVASIEEAKPKEKIIEERGMVKDLAKSFEKSEEAYKKDDYERKRSSTSTGSEKSISLDHSIDLDANYKGSSPSKLDSMEVHVDKSELEDSEKLAEIDQDITDMETKSIDSLPTIETSLKLHDDIPEITFTLSGKQRQSSEESDNVVSEIITEPETLTKQVEETKKKEIEIKSPSECIEDTVWEVSLQSQAEHKFDEKVSEIPSFSTSKSQKDEESDLDYHQDRSDSSLSDKIKSESQSEIQKIILDSLYEQKVNPQEAKLIASALIEEIESEIQKRDLVKPEEKPVTPKSNVSEYIKQLTEKGLDQREIELVESVLARRQREFAKLSRGDTQTSSMEITDEDLKYSGSEMEGVSILEQQINQLQAEKVDDLKALGGDSYLKKEIESYKEEKTSEGDEGVTKRKSSKEQKNVIFEEDESEGSEKLKTQIELKTLKEKGVTTQEKQTITGPEQTEKFLSELVQKEQKQIEGTMYYADDKVKSQLDYSSSKDAGKLAKDISICKTKESVELKPTNEGFEISTEYQTHAKQKGKETKVMHTTAKTTSHTEFVDVVTKDDLEKLKEFSDLKGKDNEEVTKVFTEYKIEKGGRETIKKEIQVEKISELTDDQKTDKITKSDLVTLTESKIDSQIVSDKGTEKSISDYNKKREQKSSMEQSSIQPDQAETIQSMKRQESVETKHKAPGKIRKEEIEKFIEVESKIPQPYVSKKLAKLDSTSKSQKSVDKPDKFSSVKEFIKKEMKSALPHVTPKVYKKITGSKKEQPSTIKKVTQELIDEEKKVLDTNISIDELFPKVPKTYKAQQESTKEGISSEISDLEKFLFTEKKKYDLPADIKSDKLIVKSPETHKQTKIPVLTKVAKFTESKKEPSSKETSKAAIKDSHEKESVLDIERQINTSIKSSEIPKSTEISKKTEGKTETTYKEISKMPLVENHEIEAFLNAERIISANLVKSTEKAKQTEIPKLTKIPKLTEAPKPLEGKKKIETSKIFTDESSGIKSFLDSERSIAVSSTKPAEIVKSTVVSKTSEIIKEPSFEELTKIPLQDSHEIEAFLLAERSISASPETTNSKAKKHERTSSSDSKSSIEFPESKLIPEVVLRHHHSDTSSSSTKPDRKSGIEFESSSGESHYQSFEIDSGKSRPCSSDVEGLVARVSSEYESALTSQDISVKSAVTSTEYQTAATSLGSKESMKSLDSESSGNLGSIEVSEVSETLVPSDADDLVEQEILIEDSFGGPKLINNLKTASTDIEESFDMGDDEVITNEIERQSKMKRSHEMTFQPEPIVSLSESLQEEKLGTSLDEGSLVSISSTSSAQRTVIERLNNEALEGSLTASGTSLDNVDFPLTTTTDMSTSTNQIQRDTQIESITIITSSIDEGGIKSVSTQVTSETQQSAEAESKKPEEPKKKSHRRQESSAFVASFIPPKLEDDKKRKFDLEKDESSGEKRDIKMWDQEVKCKTQEFIDKEKSILHDKKEKHILEKAEAGVVFNMVAHTSPAHKINNICPIPEDLDAEKHELESKQPKVVPLLSPMKDIPNIKVTQHMAPLVDTDFHYPDLEIEKKERENQKQKDGETQHSTPETPASNSSKSSEDTDQGREYVLEDSEISVPSAKIESKSDATTVLDKTVKEETDKDTDSPNSDSFEMLEKPDIIDDFVVIEEVAREASEFDTEGKSVTIQQKTRRVVRKKQDDIEVEDEYLVKSAPTPLTSKMTDVKYYPADNSSSEELGFDFEDSPPQLKQKSKDSMYEYDRELEANKKWMEQQFQGDQAAMMAAGYNYDMEFERGPLEDIKEEDINDFDLNSSRIGSLGSQKESGGSLGSVKDSYSSTPEYDVLAGRKYFTRSGEHDDVSMSSLQEFESLEKAMSLENRRILQGSQDSSSNGSFKTRYLASKSGQGDDVSVNSLKEFEGLEMACIAAHKIETKAKEEEAMLAQIDEGQESLISESDSCKTVSTVSKKLDSDEEDYEKRMFEIDEIIKQAQTNVERFVDLKEGDKTESLGRGDSIEEVSKVPDLELDQPGVKSTIKVQWKENEDVMITSTDSLDLKPEKKSHHDSTDSLEIKTGADLMTASTDSIEQDKKPKKEEESSHLVYSDSLEFGQAAPTYDTYKSTYDHSSGSTGKDVSSKDECIEQDIVMDCMLESTDSLEPTSSNATHATYQYETDSVFSGSFTSGGSNTMVSSTDTIDPTQRENTDLSTAARQIWYEKDLGDMEEYMQDSMKPYVTEVIEPCEDDSYSHTIHRRVEFPTKVTKLTFTGPDAESQLEKYLLEFNEGENVEETEEVDPDGNIHVTRVVQKRILIKSDDKDEEKDAQKQLKQFAERDVAYSESKLTVLTKKSGEEKDNSSDVSTTSKDENGSTDGGQSLQKEKKNKQ